MSLILGNMTNTFVAYQLDLQSQDSAAVTAAGNEFLHTVSLDACYLVLIGMAPDFRV